MAVFLYLKKIWLIDSISMKTILFSFLFVLLVSCKKEIPCIHAETKIITTHRNSIQCHLFNSGFIIKSEKELKTFYDSLKCNSSSDYVTPLNFEKTWMIGYSGDAEYYKLETSAELHKDTCNKLIVYNYILKQDSTSGLRDPLFKAVEIRYCLIPAFPSDYQVIFNKTMEYEKLP